ncbi:metal ABC transporter substrate-binding protein [Caenimonas sedimenti]|uniref:Metal ABC transporter substrate-binding protein n=1 Tax=Caenimonas sedimenti TaxID=2596921 RepID=A0A562ZX77_9BURK|nr:ABC transporter substrate-binding protein [Caenimonas sedimenti]TWO72928.1 metal ABC transporter substrate-binding protein [Caenimonas sedimenti]
MKYIRSVAVALATCVVAVAAQAQTKITLGHTGVAEYLGAFVAQEEGLFKKHGLEVTLQQVAGGALVPGLQGGSLQMGTLPPTNLLLANEGGLDLVFVAGTGVFEKTDQNVGLLAGAGSGITSAKDLVGKKVGVPSIGGFLHVMARKWVADRGVDPKQVNFVEVNFPQTADLLKAGTIQAGVSATPFIGRAIQSGSGTALAYFPADLPPQTSGVFYGTTRQWAAANPQAVKAFRAAIADAVAMADKNPQAARAHMGKYIKLPPEVLASIPMPRLMADVTEPQVKYWVDTMNEMGLIKSRPQAAQIIVR